MIEIDWFRVWCRYYADTEAYDRRGPHRMVDGIAMPYPLVRGHSDRYALRRMRELQLVGMPGKRMACRLTYEESVKAAATDDELREWGILRDPPNIQEKCIDDV